jgi:hypothetical protein
MRKPLSAMLDGWGFNADAIPTLPIRAKINSYGCPRINSGNSFG